MRARLEDSAKGWCWLPTAQHSDRVDLQVYRDAWHSELLSTEDNVHKELITVYCGECTDAEGDSAQNYTKHWRRAQNGTTPRFADGYQVALLAFSLAARSTQTH